MSSKFHIKLMEKFSQNVWKPDLERKGIRENGEIPGFPTVCRMGKQ